MATVTGGITGLRNTRASSATTGHRRASYNVLMLTLVLAVGIVCWLSFAPAQGVGPVRLTAADYDSRGPAWNPRGDTLAFESNRDGNWNIYAVGSDGAALRQLTFDPGDERYPSWSPDGTALVFAGAAAGVTDLYILDVAAKTTRRLTSSADIESFPAWNPDGRTIAYTATRPDQGGVMNLFVIGSDGRDSRQLTHDGRSVFPRWSPGGDQLAFFSRRDTKGVDDEVYVMTVATQEAVRVTDRRGHDFSPSWTADGRSIVMVSLTPEGQRLLRIVRTDGHVVHERPDIDRVSDPAAAPDGRRIAYAAAAGRHLAVYVATVDK